jgi:hypothetical protein
MDKKDYIGIINKRVEQLYPEFVKIRRYLHENPELSTKEFNTKKYLLQLLDKYDVEIDSNIKVSYQEKLSPLEEIWMPLILRKKLVCLLNRPMIK